MKKCVRFSEIEKSTYDVVINAWCISIINAWYISISESNIRCTINQYIRSIRSITIQCIKINALLFLFFRHGFIYHKSEFLFYQFWANNEAQLFTHCSFTSCKITCYWLQSLLATPCRICLLQKSLAHRCKICSLLLAEVPRCRKSLVMQYSFLTRCRSCSLQKISSYSLGNSFVTHCNKSLVTRCRSYILQKIICHLLK